jgi:hypothetical protein
MNKDMKRIYLFAVTTWFALAITGCQDLDTFPEGSIVTQQQKEEVLALDPSKAEAGVNAIFAQFSQYAPNYAAFGNVLRHNDFGYPSIMLFTDANGYDVVSEDNGYNWMGFNLDYTDRDFTTRECRIVWNDLYKQIFTANNVIVGIDPATEEPLSQFYLAQGLAVRAFSYLILAQLYQFNYVGHETAPCVPIITDENANDVAINGAPRASVQDVYTLINTDIGKAIELLEAAEEGGITRADKRYVSAAVAYGIRARMNLTMQKWPEAASDATKAIEASEAQPASIAAVSAPAFWSVNENNWMWGIIVAETDDIVSSGIVNWISHMGSLNYGYANFSKGKQINKALYESIPATDVRKGWWLDENQTSPLLSAEQQAFMGSNSYAAFTHVKFGPYNNVTGTSVNANDIPLMRIEEMYLIKAEAEYKGGGNGKQTLENFVKQYRDPSYVCTVSDIQEEVFRQRRIELWGEGLTWYDIMRLNKGVDRRGGGFPNATMVFNIAPNDNILLWRIPESEIQANPALEDADNNPVVPLPEPVTDL